MSVPTRFVETIWDSTLHHYVYTKPETLVLYQPGFLFYRLGLGLLSKPFLIALLATITLAGAQGHVTPWIPILGVSISLIGVFLCALGSHQWRQTRTAVLHTAAWQMFYEVLRIYPNHHTIRSMIRRTILQHGILTNGLYVQLAPTLQLLLCEQQPEQPLRWDIPPTGSIVTQVFHEIGFTEAEFNTAIHALSTHLRLHQLSR